MEKVLVLDNYDSFVYNLVHYLGSFDVPVEVVRNDELELEQVRRYRHILLSPGPGLPKDAGVMPELIREFSGTHSILGVCLGHQAIAEAFGGRLKNLDRVIHGESTIARVEGSSPLFEGFPEEFEIGHYHSWVVDEKGLDEQFDITVRDHDGEIMGFSHKELPLHGVQFHPESVLTPLGKKVIENWLRMNP